MLEKVSGGAFLFYLTVPVPEIVLLSGWIIRIVGCGRCMGSSGETSSHLGFATSLVAITSLGMISLTMGSSADNAFRGALICLFAGYGISKVYDWLPGRSALLRSMFLIAVFLPGACCFGLLARDLVGNEAWYTPTRAWLRSIPSEKHVTLGILTRLSPVYSPPFSLFT